MKTVEKGNVGVAKCIAALLEQNFSVLTPFSPHEAFDLVAYKDNRFYRVQVKYRKVKNGAITAELYRQVSIKRNIKEYDKSEVDLLCLYCPDNDHCYFVPASEFEFSVSLRVDPTKNNQANGVRWARDFAMIA